MGNGPSDPGPEYLRPYREAVEAHGAAFEALLWNAPESQTLRFGAITDMVGLSGRVVADMGCGRADLAAFLKERGVEVERYIGVEGVGELLAASRERAAAERLGDCEFLGLDFVADNAAFETVVGEHGARVVVFSGSLNTLRQKDALRVLGRAWDAVSREPGGVLVFNFLSDLNRERASGDTGPARRFDTKKMIAWACDRTPLVRARTDYMLGHDATIAMRAPGAV